MRPATSINVSSPLRATSRPAKPTTTSLPGERSEPGSALDLLLTDVIMPRLSGPELAERLVERGRVKRLLYMSGYADDRSLAGGLDRRIEILSKPFSPRELALAVRGALDARS